MGNVSPSVITMARSISGTWNKKKAICDSPTPAPSIGYVSYSPDGKRHITTHAYSNEHLVMIWDTASWVTEMGILSVRMPKGDMIWDTASHPDVSEDMKRCALVPLHIERGYQ